MNVRGKSLRSGSFQLTSCGSRRHPGRSKQSIDVSIPPAFSYRPATTDDLTLLRRWLDAPEVRRWWGSPSKQFELLRADLNEPLMTMRIVSFNARPFAYAQDYEVHTWPQPHLAHLPQGSRAIDSFIGWPSMIGRDHGQAYL